MEDIWHGAILQHTAVLILGLHSLCEVYELDKAIRKGDVSLMHADFRH